MLSFRFRSAAPVTLPGHGAPRAEVKATSQSTTQTELEATRPRDNNTKTNQPSQRRKQAEIGRATGKRCRDSLDGRPRSMIALDTSGHNRAKSTLSRGGNAPSNNWNQANGDIKGNCRRLPPGGPSDRDIVRGHASSGYRDRRGSVIESESRSPDENADLDHPRYSRGLSSPDLRRGRSGKSKLTGDSRSGSLDLLRRSHECLRSGGRCTCRCTVKLYRAASAVEVGARTQTGTSSGDSRIMIGPSETGSGKPRDKMHISDLDVSSFFAPSPTAWEPSNVKYDKRHETGMKRSESVDTSLASKPRMRTRLLSDVGDKIRIDRSKSRELGTSKKNHVNPGRGRNSEKQGFKNCSGDETGCYQTVDRTTTPVFSSIPDQMYRRSDDHEKKDLSARSTAAPPKPPRSGSEDGRNSATRISVNMTTTTTTTASTTLTSNSMPRRYCQRSGSENPSLPLCLDQSSSTTYFGVRTSGLSEGRDLKSYVYRSEEEKARVLSLLDRYSSSQSSSLGLNRRDMVAYISSAKRQLGLDQKQTETTKTGVVNIVKDNDTDNKHGEIDRDISTSEIVSRKSAPCKHEPKTESLYNGTCSPDNPDTENLQIFPGYQMKGGHAGLSNLSARTLRDFTNRVPSVVITDPSGRASVAPPAKRLPGGMDQALRPEAPSVGRDPDSAVNGALPQTTFHVNGDITDSGTVRQRHKHQAEKCLRRSRVDVNSDNNNISKSRESSPEPSPDRGSLDDGRVLSFLSIPSYRCWKRAPSSKVQDKISECLHQTGICSDHYHHVRCLVDDSIRYSSLLDLLTSCLCGSLMMALFVFMFVIVFVITYAVSNTTQISAWVAFCLSAIILSCVTLLIDKKRKKIKSCLSSALMTINGLLCNYDVLCSVIEGKSCQRGTTLYFIQFNVSPCEESIAISISEKTSEDLLLTEISRRFPSLFDVITNNLTDVSAENDQTGKKVISRDLLMYFADTFVKTFLLRKKVSRDTISQTLHDKHCICNYIKNEVFCGLITKRLPGTVCLTNNTKLPASKPTLL